MEGKHAAMQCCPLHRSNVHHCFFLSGPASPIQAGEKPLLPTHDLLWKEGLITVGRRVKLESLQMARTQHSLP